MKHEHKERRNLLQRIRAIASPHMTSTAGSGVGFLFTDQDGMIRFRALPGTRDTFCGFINNGIATDYVMGCVVVLGWRNLSTALLQRLVHVAESEARTKLVQAQRNAGLRGRLGRGSHARSLPYMKEQGHG